MALPQEIVPEKVSVYGQTEDLDTLLISVFGWLTDAGDSLITDLSDRAVNLLIEEYRYQYGAG